MNSVSPGQSSNDSGPPVSWRRTPLHRSYLYTPASRPDLMKKAAATDADAIILDLEDSVLVESKPQARRSAAEFLEAIATRQVRTRAQVHVRINRDGDGYLDEDLDAVTRPGLSALRLPKVESEAGLRHVDERLTHLERARDLPAGAIRVYPTVESAKGAISLASLARASTRVSRFALGAADLLADLGAYGDDDLATLHVRSELVLHSRAAGLGPPIDSVYTDIEDDCGLRAAATRARSIGFHGKSVIHPRQLATVHGVFSPTPEAIRRAEQVVAAAAAAETTGQGAVTVDGQLVDAAIVARAQALLSLRSYR